jgi:hypothetical protein
MKAKPQDTKKAITYILIKINPYIQRYCEVKYVPQVKHLLSSVLNNLPPHIHISEQIIVHSPHVIAYDYKPYISTNINKLLKGKNDSYREEFYGNLLKLMRGTYIDLVQNGGMSRESKIAYGNFFMTLVKNVNAIEGIDTDEYLKFNDYVKEETLKLEATEPEPTDPDYFYWKYPISYLKQFETLLLKYKYIGKHENFEELFKTQSIITMDTDLVDFNGTRSELWYMLYKIYRDKLFPNGKPLHEIGAHIFHFAGKENTTASTNSAWQKFRCQMDNNVRTQDYIQKKLSKAYRLIEELKLPK